MALVWSSDPAASMCFYLANFIFRTGKKLLSHREVEMADWSLIYQFSLYTAFWLRLYKWKPVDYWHCFPPWSTIPDGFPLHIKNHAVHSSRVTWWEPHVCTVTTEWSWNEERELFHKLLTVECLTWQSINCHLQCNKPLVLVQQFLEPVVSSSCWAHLPLLIAVISQESKREDMRSGRHTG